MRLLLVEDDAKLSATLARGLRGGGLRGRRGGRLATGALFQAAGLRLRRPRARRRCCPGLTGWRSAAALREERRWSPVLMLTARDGVADRIRGLDAGADDYLVKPFDFGELSRACARCCAAAPRSAHRSSSSGDLEVDPAARTVVARAAPCRLTAREFAVLEFLVAPRRRGRQPRTRAARPRLGRALRGLHERRRRVRRLPAPQARDARSVARSSARCAAPGYVAGPAMRRTADPHRG